tara:strand:- start:1042 stop:2190 length:1149 start_codon:yes stop_codon:yes gene_type:complete
MTDIILHKSEKYINEDIDYYCSDMRDKHGMIKPDRSIISLTLNSKKFTDLIKKEEISSAFFPFNKHIFNRIYIGLSVPLFANNWGAVFLRYLLYLVDKNGYVVLPVYAERQGIEKNYWSRSALEDIFRSRIKWWGMSNIWAENDGVMSVRIGRKEPPKKNSSLNYLFDHYFEQLKEKGIENENEFHKIIKENITNATISAIVEKIIIDFFGRKKPTVFCEVAGNGLLAAEILQSNYINITNALLITADIEKNINYNKYLSEGFKKTLDVINSNEIGLSNNYDVVTIFNLHDKIDDESKNKLINKLMQNLNQEGLMILYNEKDSVIANILKSNNNYEHFHYSSIVATRLNEKRDIPHYSDIIFNELKDENKSRKKVINVIQKK